MSASEWLEVSCPLLPGSEMVGAFVRGGVRCLVSHDGPDQVWHISISCEKRYPSFEEIKKARYDLVPDEVTMAMFLPPKAEYVNIHPNCFHLHEVRE